MSLLPVSQFIGTLTIIEIYVEYNGPKLFSCRNEVGQTFLALWVDEEDDYDLWLYIAISIKKLNSIRQGHTDLHQAFLYPENKHIYEIKIPFSDKQDVKFQKIKSDLIDIDCLPLEETFIKIDSNDLETSYYWQSRKPRNFSSWMKASSAFKRLSFNGYCDGGH